MLRANVRRKKQPMKHPPDEPGAPTHWHDQYDVVQTLGNCHATVGNDAEAQHHFAQAASLEPDEPAPYVGLGVLALQNDKLDDAEVAFRVACRLNTQCSRAYAGLAMVAQRRQDLKGAFGYYLKSLELDTDNLIALLGLFQTSCEMGSFSQVTRYLELYLSAHPDDTSVMFSLAALYLKDGLLDKSRTVLLAMLTRDPHNTDAQDLLEEVEHDLAQTEQPLAVLPRACPARRMPA